MKRFFALILALSFAIPAFAVEQLKQSSTAQPLTFLMIDSTDHISGKTGLSPTVTLSKAGGSFASPSGSVSEIANGWYKVAGNATDTATLGPLILHATGTGADVRDEKYEVVAVDPQSATSYITGVNAVAPPTNWNLTSIDSNGIVKANEQFRSGKTIFVSTTGGSSSGPGTLAAPYDTYAHAEAVANPGDTIHLIPGTYSTAITVGKHDLTIEGDGDTSLVSVSSGSAIITTGVNRVTVRGLKAVTTDAVGFPTAGIESASGVGQRFEYVTATGISDGFYGTNLTNVSIDHCSFQSSWDGGNLSGSALYDVRNTQWISTATNTLATAFRGCVAGKGGRFENCQFIVTRSAATSLRLAAVDTLKNSPSGPVGTFVNCYFLARATNASNTGDISGISNGEETTSGTAGALPVICTITGGVIDVSKNSSSTSTLRSIDVGTDVSRSGSLVKVSPQTVFDASLVRNYSTESNVQVGPVGDLPGTGRIALSSGAVTVGTNNDKSTYTLSSAYDPAKTAAQAGDVMKVSSGTGTNQINLSGGHVVNVDTLATYTGNTPQTGDAYSRIGANGAGLTAIGDTAGTTTLLTRLSALRAGYLDNINNTALQTSAAQTGDAFALIGAAGSGLTVLATSVNQGTIRNDIAGIDTKLGTPAHSTVVGDIANVSSGSGSGGTPAQVHNQEIVMARVSKLGTRADGVTIAYPPLIVRPGEVTQVWVDCSKYAGANIGNVTDAASSNEAKVSLTSAGMKDKYVSFILDETAAVAGDTATISCFATPFGTTQKIDVQLPIVVQASH